MVSFDITKLERAKHTLRNSKTESAESSVQVGEVVPKQVTQTSAKATGIAPVSRKGNVLPDFCLLCKGNGPIYITDQVLLLALKLF